MSHVSDLCELEFSKSLTRYPTGGRVWCTFNQDARNHGAKVFWIWCSCRDNDIGTVRFNLEDSTSSASWLVNGYSGIWCYVYIIIYMFVCITAQWNEDDISCTWIVSPDTDAELRRISSKRWEKISCKKTFSSNEMTWLLCVPHVNIHLSLHLQDPFKNLCFWIKKRSLFFWNFGEMDRMAPLAIIFFQIDEFRICRWGHPWKEPFMPRRAVFLLWFCWLPRSCPLVPLTPTGLVNLLP